MQLHNSSLQSDTKKTRKRWNLLHKQTHTDTEDGGCYTVTGQAVPNVLKNHFPPILRVKQSYGVDTYKLLICPSARIFPLAPASGNILSQSTIANPSVHT